MLQHGYQFTPGTDLHSVVSSDTVARLREHVFEVAALLKSILSAGVDVGVIPEQDLDATVRLIHSCLQGWSLAPAGGQREREINTVTVLGLRAVGMDGKSTRLNCSHVASSYAVVC